jgi:hypothetical protein
VGVNPPTFDGRVLRGVDAGADPGGDDVPPGLAVVGDAVPFADVGVEFPVPSVVVVAALPSPDGFVAPGCAPAPPGR